MMRLIHTVLACATILAASAQNPYSTWTNGPARDPDYFPIAVWLQNPANAERYKAAGINLYIGLWRGPTPEQIARLKKAGMRVIACPNQYALEHKDDPIFAGWMHDDEPDNAQPLRNQGGYGPPILPEVVIREYEEMRASDPSRPVFLNLGQGVAWDDWIGRGVRTRHPEDYPLYVKGADIVSFDIYPVVHDHPDVAGKLEFVARGVSRLREWTEGKKIVWNCIECTRISNPRVKPTPGQVRSEVWMSLIHGSQGIVYFVHQFEPVFREAALLDDPEMLAGVTAINRQIRELAPVLNSATVTNRVKSSVPADEVAVMVKVYRDETYIFAVAMRNTATKTTFAIADLDPSRKVEVIGESREIAIQDGRFTDSFEPYQVHLYRLR